MVRTPSTMVELGTEAPDFSLRDVVTGETVSRDDLREGPGFLVAFWCNHCPFVKHVEDGFLDFAREYLPRGLRIVAISSNDVENYPDDSPEKMRALAKRKDYPFPYLYDEDQSAALAYRAACTPDFFLFDGDGRLAYRGQFDASRPSKDTPVTGTDLRAAAAAVLAGKTPPAEQVPSLGCNIKWKAGNAPEWFGA